jgi:hypothetical protein
LTWAAKCDGSDINLQGVESVTARIATNKLLHKAKKSKSDEFYTQYVDIQKEVESYLEQDPDVFRGKIVYCNCDDPFESNFFPFISSAICCRL